MTPRFFRRLAFGACSLSLLFAAPSALHAQDWIDLMPGPKLQGWKRVAIAPDTKLSDKNPWSLDQKEKLLLCDGVGIKEMLLYNRALGDGTFHVEWRFRKVDGKAEYNGGVYVLCTPDGKVWHQAQVAHPQKAPNVGDLFGTTLVDGQPQSFLVQGKGSQLAHPPGAWNTFDITCQGPRITVNVNGQQATVWDKCQVERGHVGLQAEFYFLEFRNIRFRPAAK